MIASLEFDKSMIVLSWISLQEIGKLACPVDVCDCRSCSQSLQQCVSRATAERTAAVAFRDYIVGVRLIIFVMRLLAVVRLPWQEENFRRRYTSLAS